ncbi:MAG: hypothetical protein AAF581_06570 [Planctomycetota bacterium]
MRVPVLFAVLAMLVTAFLCPATSAQPVNDTCSGAIALAVGANPFDSTGATTGTSAAPQCASTSSNDVWFTYTALATGTVEFDTNGSSYDTVLTAYDTTTCPPGFTNQIACNQANDNRIFFIADASVTYLIRVSARAFASPSSGVGVVNVQEVPVPSNNECTTPMALVTPATVNYDTTAATFSTNYSCPMGADLWYSVTAPITGKIVVTKSNLVHHAIYPLAAGACPTQLADEVYCSLQERTSTSVVSGQSYLIRVAPNVWATDAAIGTLTVDFVTTPANDDCSTPEAFVLGSTLSIDTIGATTDPSIKITCNPPPFGDELNHSDLWYSFTAPISGSVEIDLTNDPEATPYHTLYEVPAVGTCPTIMDEVNCSQQPNSATPVSAGSHYVVRVGQSIFSHFYAGDLTIDILPPQVADSCSNPAAASSGTPMALDTTSASISPVGMFPGCDMDKDVWYSITVPGDGFLNINVTITSNNGNPAAASSHAVYQLPGGPGTCPSNADEIGCTQFFTVSTSPVLAGQTYLVRVGETFQGTITGTVLIEYLGPPAHDNCATPQLIAAPIAPATSVSVPYNTAAATPGPALASGNCPFPIMKDLWYQVTSPITGTLRIDVDFPATGNPYHEFYNAPAGGGCPTIADSIDCTANPYFSERPVSAGQTYLIRLGHNNNAAALAGDLVLTFNGPPLNDDCTGAQVVSVPAVVGWDVNGATNDTNGLGGGGSCTGCGFTCNSGPFNDVWFRFVAPATGQMELQNTPLAPITQTGWTSFVIYEYNGPGCPSDSDAVGCRTGGENDTFDVVGGSNYFVRIGRVSASGQVSVGEIALSYLLAAPTNLICDSSVPDQVTASYTIPTGSSYDLGVDVFVNGLMVANIPQTQLSYTHNLTPGFLGVVEIGFQGLNSSAGMTPISTCNAAFGAPANDLCASALPVTLTTYAIDNFGTSTDSTAPAFSCGNGSSDLWFALTPPTNGIYRASTCGLVSFDSVIEVFDGSTGCPTHSSVAIACNDFATTCPLNNAQVEWVGVSGTTYYIRLGGGTAFNGSTGAGDITFSQACPDVVGLTCSFDCALQEVTLDWTGGTHFSYDIFSSAFPGGPLITGLGGGPFSLTPLGTGEITYTVVGNCPGGATSSAFCSLVIVDPMNIPPVTDLVLALEGSGGFTNSVNAVEQALIDNGKTPWSLPLVNFGDLDCFPQIAAAAERIWVINGTSPDIYSLTAADGDALAAYLQTGGDVYFESADHWGNAHVPSNLDARDGVASALDGDGTLTSLDGVDSGIPGTDLSGYADVTYMLDSQAFLDLNDQLTLDPGTVDLTTGPLWRNNDDSTGSPEPDYITGVIAAHSDGGIMISCSWEFGGFAGDRNALMADYLNAFLGAPPVDEFRRGDCNDDAAKNIADPVRLLNFLFPPVAPPAALPCDSACDANDDGGLNIADAVAMLNVLFPIGAPIPWIAPDACGGDPTPDALTCDAYTMCP